MSHGSSAFEATRQAYAMVASTIDRQASVMSYVDCFFVLGIAVTCYDPVRLSDEKSKTRRPDGGTLTPKELSMSVRIITIEREYGSGGAIIAGNSPSGSAGNSGIRN